MQALLSINIAIIKLETKTGQNTLIPDEFIPDIINDHKKRTIICVKYTIMLIFLNFLYNNLVFKFNFKKNQQ